MTPMILGFFGSDEELQIVLRHQQQALRHGVLPLVVESSPTSSNSSTCRPHDPRSIPKQNAAFENFLFLPKLNAFVLGGPVELRLERLRRIVQLGRHCLCFLPVDMSALVYHELAMSAADTKAVLMPWLPARLHAVWQELIRICRSGLMGLPRQIIVDRSGPMPSGRLIVSHHYAEVVDLLSELAGDITEVTATGDLAVGRLIVQHRTSRGISGEIRLTANLAEDHCKVLVEADHGRAELLWSSGLAGPAVLHWTGPDGSHEFAHAGFDSARSLFSELSRASDRLTHSPNWTDAIRAAELADCAWQSLERRRAVDIYREKRNELASFKGRMTSIGCGLLWFTLLILIVISAGKGLQLPGMDILAGALAALWIAFLGVQTLRWAFPRADAHSGNVDKDDQKTESEF